MNKTKLEFLGAWFIFGVIVGSCIKWITPDLSINFSEVFIYLCATPLITGAIFLGIGFLFLVLFENP